MNPVCIYGITKTAGVHICRHYRENFGVFASSGILYNHESQLRPEKFVLSKIINTAVRIQRGDSDQLVIGDLSARVDWGYAFDFVDAMTRVLGLNAPDDFVIATGLTYSVRDAVQFTFEALNLDWQDFVTESPQILTRQRPTLCGDFSKLKSCTGWSPTVTFREMINLILNARIKE